MALNRVILSGRLTKDLEIKKTTSGKSVVSFTLAVDGRKDANGNQTADFISCTAWNGTADLLVKYCKKGSLIGVDGELHTRSYEKKDGTKARVTEVIAKEVTFFSTKGKNEEVEQITEVQQETTSGEVLDIDGDLTPEDLPF